MSQFAGDEEMAELIEFFIAQVEGHAESLREAMEARDVAALKTISHQLKGAAGGYGFPQIGASAADLERAALSEEADLNELREKAESLIGLCRRIAA